MKKILFALTFSAFLIIAGKSNSLYAQIDNSTLSSKSHVDWTEKKFTSKISLDVKKAGLELPAGRNSAESRSSSSAHTARATNATESQSSSRKTGLPTASI